MPYVALAHAGRIHYAERGERRPDRPSAVLIHGAGEVDVGHENSSP